MQKLLEDRVVISARALQPDVIYLTKYRGQQVGERSVGLHPAIANDIAAMLRAAVAMCRTRSSQRKPEKKGNQNAPSTSRTT